MINKVLLKTANKFSRNTGNIAKNVLCKNEIFVAEIEKTVAEEHFEKSTKPIPIFKNSRDRTKFIQKLSEKGDTDTLEPIIDMNNLNERFKYKLAVSEKMEKETGVGFGAINTKEGINALKQGHKILKDYLILYKKLGMTLPDEIIVRDLKFDGVKNTSAAKTEYEESISERFPLFTRIILDKNIFDEKYKGDFKTTEEFVLSVFHHELTHSRQMKENLKLFDLVQKEGLDFILNAEDKKVWLKFKDLCKKHYPLLNDLKWVHDINQFETNLFHDPDNFKHRVGVYNMWGLGLNINRLTNKLIKRHKFVTKNKIQPREYLQNFNKDFLKEIKKIQKKFEKVIGIIKTEGLRSYGFCNPNETVAVAAEKEYRGEALSDEFRKLVKFFGYPETKHMSYLPDEHPAMKLMNGSKS